MPASFTEGNTGKLETADKCTAAAETRQRLTVRVGLVLRGAWLNRYNPSAQLRTQFCIALDLFQPFLCLCDPALLSHKFGGISRGTGMKIATFFDFINSSCFHVSSGLSGGLYGIEYLFLSQRYVRRHPNVRNRMEEADLFNSS
ncbi:MAG: hypothetical protein ACLSUW_04535 [Akkermansia sp.]